MQSADKKIWNSKSKEVKVAQGNLTFSRSLLVEGVAVWFKISKKKKKKKRKKNVKKEKKLTCQ